MRFTEASVEITFSATASDIKRILRLFDASGDWRGAAGSRRSCRESGPFSAP
jgi:hypothetical protein